MGRFFAGFGLASVLSRGFGYAYTEGPILAEPEPEPVATAVEPAVVDAAPTTTRRRARPRPRCMSSTTALSEYERGRSSGASDVYTSPICIICNFIQQPAGSIGNFPALQDVGRGKHRPDRGLITTIFACLIGGRQTGHYRGGGFVAPGNDISLSLIPNSEPTRPS